MANKQKYKKIKVLNVLTGIHDGGMETLVFRIYQSLEEKEIFEFYVCSLINVDENFLVENFRNLDTKVKILNFKNKGIKLSDYFKNFIEIIKLGRFISKNKIDIVNSHDFFSGTVTRLAIIFAFVLFHKPQKVYVTLHNLFFWLKPFHHFVNRILSVFTSKIICVSKSVYEYSLRLDRIKKSKYQIIYNGIDTNEFVSDAEQRKTLRKTFGYSDQDIVIGNIGTFSVRKGQKYLLEAFSHLYREHNNIKLILIGSMRTHEVEILEYLNEFVKKNNLLQVVKFLDTQKNVKILYNIFDIYVMSSKSEGFSLAALEAMLMEKICIFSDIGPFKELVTENINGFLFESENADSLKEKLETVINDYGKLQNMKLNARKTVIERFSYDEMIESYYKLYSI